MAIEFSCPHCQHLLRTSDDKAGLSAKCPACSEVIRVPYSSEAAPFDAPAVSGDAAGEPEGVDVPLARAVGPGQSDSAVAGAGPEDSAQFKNGPSGPRPGDEVYCPGCHATNAATASHCRFCGTSLEGAQRAGESPLPLRTPEVGEVLSTTWRIFSMRLGLLIGAALLTIPLGLLGLAVSALPTVLMIAAFSGADDDLVPVGLAIGLVCSIPLLLILGAVLSVGVLRLHLNIARGAAADIGDLLYGFQAEGRTLVPGMLLILVVAAIAGLVVIGPMLIWPLGYLHVDRRLPIGETFTQFFNRLTNDFAYVLLIGLVIWGLGMLVGVLICPCCIGLLLLPFVPPFTNLLSAVGYLRWVGERTVLD